MLKPFIFTLCLAVVCFGFSAAAEVPASAPGNCQLSTHIQDVNLGRPAAGVPILLFRLTDGGKRWEKIGEAVTDANGRVGTFLPRTRANDGIYKLKFETRDYFRKQGRNSIYPFVEVVFELEGTGHYHIPITMSANGYGTYRGN